MKYFTIKGEILFRTYDCRVKQGKTTKDIAEFMNLSARTVEFHRNSVRKKIGLKNAKVNLRTYLLSLPSDNSKKIE